MELESYQIPASYQGYLETFEKDPDLAISRLENHVDKRNTGAVGYFFLAWLYFKNQQKEQALDAALQAKTLAPGSIFFEHLHYYIVHPKGFTAWEPRKGKTLSDKTVQPETSHPIHDLDLLIDKLSSANTKKIKLKLGDEPGADLSEKSSNVDDIVTETLAVIHEKQKNYTAAISTYKQLKKINPQRETHFDNQIQKLVQKKKDEA